jgi:hypothetical protein
MSGVHLNAADEKQIVSWHQVKAAMSDDRTAAVAALRA